MTIWKTLQNDDDDDDVSVPKRQKYIFAKRQTKKVSLFRKLLALRNELHEMG